ncbi:response regulator [Desulfonatronovibrio hydrogenovorans]|uniref:response regulator n=1 Tax=Desulfonatronovibrio hydrogenovorans TaxID=53245 RepID=UPI001FC97686|nr:response regulator [Desulfonatronovibrio hydrogenovorans]
MDRRFRSPQILIVDDSPLNRKLLKVLLGGAGYSTLEAGDGRQAVQEAQKHRPDLILLDVVMPVFDGFQTCAELKANPRTRDIPVIFISSLNDTENIVKGLELGGVDYIGKPFARTEVLARIRVHLELKFARERLVEAQVSRFADLKEAQESFLVDPEKMSEAGFRYIYRPVLEAGGDFLDVIRIGQDTYVYIVADISGHNLGTAYMTSALKVLFDQNINAFTSVDEGLKMINAVLNRIFKPTQHLTASFLVVNRHQNLVDLYNAGHLPVIHVRKKNSQAEVLEAEGDILGPFEQVEFFPKSHAVEPGDRFYLFTDGLVETSGTSSRQRAQGIGAILDLAARSMDFSLNESVEFIFDRICPDKSLLIDDIILLGTEV